MPRLSAAILLLLAALPGSIAHADSIAIIAGVRGRVEVTAARAARRARGSGAARSSAAIR